MATDIQDLSIQKSRANRRGFLVGIALAELMLIILFVLLLLNRNFQIEQQEAENEIADVREDFGGDEGFSEARVLASELADNLSPSELSETWRTITRTIAQLGSGSDSELPDWIEELENELVEEPDADDGSQPEDSPSSIDLPDNNAESVPESMQEQIDRLTNMLENSEANREQYEQRNRELEQTIAEQQSALADSAGERFALSLELARAKAGELVICTYTPPQPDSLSALRGKSVPLGTLHLEIDGVTLIEKNSEFQQNIFVDYVGDRYDASDAIALLNTWPVLQKLGFEDLDEIGRLFIEIGDRDVETRSRCRFSMDYYIEDFETPHSVLETFEWYFFQQSRVSDSEFEQLFQTNTQY